MSQSFLRSVICAEVQPSWHLKATMHNPRGQQKDLLRYNSLLYPIFLQCILHLKLIICIKGDQKPDKKTQQVAKYPRALDLTDIIPFSLFLFFPSVTLTYSMWELESIGLSSIRFIIYLLHLRNMEYDEMDDDITFPIFHTCSVLTFNIKVLNCDGKGLSY